MPDSDGQIRVGLSVDTSQLPGAAASVEQFNERAKAATEAYNAAAKQGKEVNAALGKSFTEAQAAGKTYVESMEAAVAAVKELKTAEEAEAEAKRQQRLALIQQNRDYQEYVAAQKAAVAAQKAADAAQKASQASLRTLSTEMSMAEGRTQGSTRALAALIQKFPALAGAGQAAFTAFGIFAGIEIAVQFGEALYNAFDLGGKRAEKTRESVEEMNNALNHSITTLDVQIDKLQQEQAKLEHVPFNGMKLALDEAAEAAQNLSDKLDETIKKELEALRDKEGAFNPSTTQTVLMGTTGNHQEQVMLDEHVKWLNKAKSTQDELNESISYGAKVQERLTHLVGLQAEIQGMRAAGGPAVDIIGTKDYSKEIAGLQMMMDVQKKEEQQIRGTIQLQKEQSATQKDRDATKAGQDFVKSAQQEMADKEQQGHDISVKEETAFWQKKKAEAEAGGNKYLGAVEAINLKLGELAHKSYSKTGKDPNIEALREIEESYAAINDARVNVTGHPLTGGEAAAFWEQYLATFDAKTTQAKTIINNYAHAQEEMHKQLSEGMKKVEESQSKMSGAEGEKAFKDSTDAIAKWRQETNAGLTQTGEAWEHYRQEQTKGLEIAAQNAQAEQLETIAVKLSQGAITSLSAAKATASIHTAEYTVKINALREELARLRAEAQAGGHIDPITGNNNDSKNAGQQQQVQNQITQLSGQERMAATKDSAAITNDIAKPYLDAWSEITSSFMRAQQQMLTGHKTFSQAMQQEEASLAMFAIQNIEKKMFAFITAEIKQSVAHTVSKDMQVTGDAAAATTTDAISLTSALKKIGHEASVAAAKAYSAMAGIPPAPIWGVLAAGVAYAGVMALAAFEQGGIIPNTGIAMVHQGEAVIPQPLTKMLTDTASNGGSGGGGGHRFSSTYAPQITVLDSKGLESFTRRAGDHLSTQMMRQARKANSIM